VACRCDWVASSPSTWSGLRERKRRLLRNLQELEKERAAGRVAEADYLELRAAAIATDVDRAILARTIVEIITTWAVKMPWDRAPRPYPDDTAAACGTMIRHLVTGGTR